MDKPEALRLAEDMERPMYPHYNPQAAAELHRLHTENERLHQANEAFSRRQEWWNEKMFALEAQRDVLLEALKAMLEQFNYHTISGIVHDESAAIAKAHAAIKAVEETK